MAVVTMAACDKTETDTGKEGQEETPGPGGEEDGPGDEEQELAFDVTAADKTYAVGEKVVFTLSGNAHEIEFWSGEEGHRYEYRDGHKVDITKVQLEFTNNLSNSRSAEGRVFETRNIYVSTDFNGERTVAESINAATWTDVTDLFTLATSYNKENPTESGTGDLTQYVEADKPFYLAFYAKTAAFNVASEGPCWQVYTPELTGETEDGEPVMIGEMDSESENNFDFTIFNIDDENNSLGNSKVGGNYFVLQLGTGPVTKAQGLWAISRELNAGYIQLAPESCKIVKYDWEQPSPETFTYAFDAAGEYDVVFIGRDSVTREEIVKHVTIIVE